jgi:hypothetical protein
MVRDGGRSETFAKPRSRLRFKIDSSLSWMTNTKNINMVATKKSEPKIKLISNSNFYFLSLTFNNFLLEIVRKITKK